MIAKSFNARDEFFKPAWSTAKCLRSRQELEFFKFFNSSSGRS